MIFSKYVYGSTEDFLKFNTNSLHGHIGPDLWPEPLIQCREFHKGRKLHVHHSHAFSFFPTSVGI